MERLTRRELAGLRVRRFDPARCRVEVRETVSRLAGELIQDTPKSKKSNRVVPIPPPVARLLADHIAAHGLGPDDYVFGTDGKPLNHQSFYRFRFKPAAERVGLVGLRFHDYAPHVRQLVATTPGRTLTA